MKIYTKTGDDGSTGLFGGPRVAKDAARIEAYGAIDELNSILGMVRCGDMPPGLDLLVARLQHELFDLGAELATPDPERMGVARVGATHIEELEQAIDHFESALEPLKQFILPGGTRAAAELHLARTVCRRAERRLTTLAGQETISPQTGVYLNRLSDLLFVMARFVNRAARKPDTPWRPAADR